MTWSRFDDRYDEHEQVEDAWFSFPANPVGLHVMATTACNRWNSDGVIKPRWLLTKLPDGKIRERILAAMVKYELFDLIPAGETRDYATGDGEVVTLGPFDSERYVVHGFFKFHDSAEKRGRDREWDRRRKELERDRDLVEAIRSRDQDRCRYCGLLVNWRDRRSPKGGTYDHVTPRGDNSLENVVVACRGCNGRKGARTPAEANMPLLAPGQIAAKSRLDVSSRGSRSVQAPLPDPTHSLPDPEEDQAATPQRARAQEQTSGSQAETVRCPRCDSEPGEKCMGVRGPRESAHLERHHAVGELLHISPASRPGKRTVPEPPKSPAARRAEQKRNQRHAELLAHFPDEPEFAVLNAARALAANGEPATVDAIRAYLEGAAA